MLDLESQLPALTEADVNGQLVVMLANEHHSTWFTVQGSGSRFQFRRGVLPGDPNGDLVFAFLAGKMLQRIHDAFAAEGLLLECPAAAGDAWWPGAGGDMDDMPADASFVDDAAFFLAGSAERITDMISKAVRIVDEVMDSFMLDVNFLPGKTEVLVDIRGPASRAVKRDLLVERLAVLEVATATRSVTVVLTPVYKHLGAMVAIGGALHDEATHRATSTAQTWAALRRGSSFLTVLASLAG